MIFRGVIAWRWRARLELSGVEVMGLARGGEDWLLHFAGAGAPVPCDIVISTAPVAQSRALFGVESEIGGALSAVKMDPCWVLMLAFERRLDRGFDVIRPEGSELDWICRDQAVRRWETVHLLG